MTTRAIRSPVPPWDWRASEKARRAAKRQPAGVVGDPKAAPAVGGWQTAPQAA
jgi:hypothetical protein